jgi:hypothetical protein
VDKRPIKINSADSISTRGEISAEAIKKRDNRPFNNKLYAREKNGWL